MTARSIACTAVCAVFALTMTIRPAEAHHRHCEETSSVVGYARCARFGSRWSLPRWVPSLSVSFGLTGHRFRADPIALRDAAEHAGAAYIYRVVGARGADMSITAIAPTLRMTATFGRWYGGTEAEIGGLLQGPRLTAEAIGTDAAVPAMHAALGRYVAARGLAGIRATAGRVSVSAELAGGLRAVVFDTTSQLSGDVRRDSVYQERMVLEARVRAGYWLDPWLSVAVTFGSSLVDMSDRSVGIEIAGHARPFGGR